MEISRTAASLCVLLLAVVATLAKEHKGHKDMMKKSIVFDKNTPDVFYCPQSKPTGIDKMLVRARPLKKLCEHDGNPLPEDYKSDCYNDVDETSYACKEKYRIMKRLVKPKPTDADAESTAIPEVPDLEIDIPAEIL